MSEVLGRFNQIADEITEELKKKLPSWSQVDSPKSFREMELEVASLTRRFQDGVTTAILEDRLAAPDFQQQTSQAACDTGPYRLSGWRSCKVRLLGGSTIRVRTRYLRRDRRGLPGRRRGRGKRGRSGSGLYPALVALGITFGASPALAAEVSCQITDSDSFRTGLAALKRRGIDLNHKPTHKLVNDISKRANTQRQEWLDQARNTGKGILAGKRVVVAIDGGRLRERQPRERGRRRKDTGHRGFDAPWREPKMLVIYTINEQGRLEDEFRPIYDGTLGDCDALFQMLGAYLQALGADAAHELLVVGDGAQWIWNRADELRERLGLQPEQMTQVIDWYHAVEVLHSIAKIPAKWQQDQRDRWVRRAKKFLAAGDIDGLVPFIEELAQGRRSKDIRKHLGYFDNNRERMQYAAFREACAPLGSGAVESMIRRVVNQRMKGNAKFWLEENAEGMLLLRSYLKAGRFDDLLDWSFATTASWWPPAVAAAPVAPVAT